MRGCASSRAKMPTSTPFSNSRRTSTRCVRMADELFSYYNAELSAIRQLAKEFGEAHRREAGSLALREHEPSPDPHVERLIEAVAFLTARVRHKIDEDFPELTEALLNVLYPHYLAPIPSTAIVQFVVDP